VTIIIIIFYLLNSPGIKKIRYAIQKSTKKQAGMNLTPPPPPPYYYYYCYYYFLAHQHKACRQLKIKQEMTAVGDYYYYY